MANALKPVAVTQLTGSMATIYTVPALTTFTVSMLHLVNTTTAAATVRVCVVPTGGSALQSNAIMWDFSITANDVLEILKGDIWAAGTTLQASTGTASAINVKLSGIETS